MIAQALTRKLLLYVLYSAAVTALPVLASTPLAHVPSLPVLQTEEPPARCDCQRPEVQPPERPVVTTARSHRAERWWCRGPVRRAVRGVALFVSRPWRR